MLPIKKILCPTDFSDSSLEALRVSGELADHFSSELIVIHVVQPIPVLRAEHMSPSSFNVPSYQQEMEISSMKILEEHIADLKNKLSVRPLVVIGDPADQIVQTAEKEHVDLLIIATRGQTGLKRLVMGSVAEKVVRHAPMPVLTTRGTP